MKKRVVIILLFGIFSIYGMDVNEILNKMEENENPQTSKMTMIMTVVDPDGREMVSELISYSADKGDKGLMEYVSPARIKGMKILTLNKGKDIWFYSPRTGRVRKIASGQRKESVNNSDFSFEDLSTSDTREDYEAKLLSDRKIEEIDCYSIEMIPKKKDLSYSKIVFFVDKNTYVPREVHFFDESGTICKKMFMKNIVKNGKYWNAEKIEMHNLIKGSKTILKISKVEYDIELDKELFSERNLKR
ncbi:MAG: outer membrane lipoprotein-sorting protein [Chitinispirillaceae bacterium]|nr:outer membrane lipoprotein-sorting protein [Chitinispirillaceae bacterium]